MRISAVTQTFQSEFRRVEGTRKGGKAQKAGPSHVDRSEISSNAKRLSETQAQVETLATQVAGQPEVRTEKIAEVQEKINNGFYDSPEFIDRLADKMAGEFMGELGLS